MKKEIRFQQAMKNFLVSVLFFPVLCIGLFCFFRLVQLGTELLFLIGGAATISMLLGVLVMWIINFTKLKDLALKVGVVIAFAGTVVLTVIALHKLHTNGGIIQNLDEANRQSRQWEAEPLD